MISSLLIAAWFVGAALIFFGALDRFDSSPSSRDRTACVMMLGGAAITAIAAAGLSA